VIANNTNGALRVGCSPNNVMLNGCTLYGNSGIIIESQGANYLGISHSVIAFNPSSQTMDGPDTLQVDCTDIYGNLSGDWVGISLWPFRDINGNISEDPDFCDAPNGNFHVSDGSPCVAPCGLMGTFGVGCSRTNPYLQLVEDVPDDQGGWVRLEWIKSRHDSPGSNPKVEEYDIYRSHDPMTRSSAGGVLSSARTARAAHAEKGPLLAATTDWDYIATVPATEDSLYEIVVETVCDSTIALGPCLTGYYLSAKLSGTGGYIDSNAMRGYSVDNLAPGLPQNVAAAYNTGSGNYLTWDPPGDPDVAYYRVYRDYGLIAETTEQWWTDTLYDGWNVSYEISAVDTSGNEGPKADPDQTTAVETPRTPDAFALYPNVPNPFNPATTVRYDVPATGGHVTITIYDVNGRLVRTLVNEVQAPGEKSVTWNGRDDNGTSAASGVYFYKMRAPGYVMTRKMVLLR